MKTLSKLLFALIVTISCISCEKIENGDNNNSNNNDINKQEDFYYVRFEASSSQTFISVKVSLTGSESFSTSGGLSFSEILGPAKRGSIASIKTLNYNCTTCNTAIYVSKNNGPFALKKTGGNSLEYTIDF